MFFYPDYRFRRVWEITPQWLRAKNIHALLLDVDNTLAIHNGQEIDGRVLDWLHVMRLNGIRLAILSNNSSERVEPFATHLGLQFFARAHKPLGGGARRAMRFLGTKSIAVVGDQIFTDILCARLAGLVPVLVDPIETEPFFFFKVKRCAERLVLRGCNIPFEKEKTEE